MSIAQQIFSDGFAALLEVHGAEWSFKDATFQAVVTRLERDDPRMGGSGDQLLSVRCLTSDVPVPAPNRGDSLTFDGRSRRIVRPIQNDPATGITTFLVTET